LLVELRFFSFSDLSLSNNPGIFYQSRQSFIYGVDMDEQYGIK